MLSPSEQLRQASNAMKQGDYLMTISILEPLVQKPGAISASELSNAQMLLVKAYRQNHQLDNAIALCEQLTTAEDLRVQDWAKQALQGLLKAQAAPAVEDVAAEEDEQPAGPTPFRKAERAAAGVITRFPIAKTAANLTLASSITLIGLLGMVLTVGLSVFLIMTGENPLTGLIFSIIITIVFNTAVFFLSPLLMDLIQNWLYGTQWVSLRDIERQSPEAAQIIQQICQRKNLQLPRLGIIQDQNPTAFTYGSLPNTARLVVSQGLFTYLDEDEVATVYAHEMGHIVHWDFAVMTLGATLVQILYLVYSFAQRFSRGESNKLKDALGSAAIMAYIFHEIGTYMLLYLSRTREYYADHFAAEVTGNPNALSRALVKIAYGIVEEGKREKEPSRLVEGTRALGIYDPKAAASTGVAYRIADTPEKVGRVFLWDLFNPWAWWIELSSTHPLTGKRIRALSTYAERLGLAMEFDMGRIVGEGKRLNRLKLHRRFVSDLVIYILPWVVVALGLILALVGLFVGGGLSIRGLSLGLIGFGAGTLLQVVLMFPDYDRARETDVFTLMSDPYASPLRGRPVKLRGELIGRGDAGSKLGSDLKLQDPGGMIYLHYSSRFGPIGNALFGYHKVKMLLGEQVNAIGWFRRGAMPWVDLALLSTASGERVSSYHRFWSVILGGGAVVLGFLLPGLLG
jgi:Zn-dependent protease with chaperone function